MNSYANNTKLKEGYKQLFSNYKFSYFVTLTYPFFGNSEEAAMADLGKEVYFVNCKIFGRNHHKEKNALYSKSKNKGISLIAALDRNTSSGLHWHLLIQNIDIPEHRRDKFENKNAIEHLITETWSNKVVVGGRQTDFQPVYYKEGIDEYIADKVWISDEAIKLDWFKAL